MKKFALFIWLTLGQNNETFFLNFIRDNFYQSVLQKIMNIKSKRVLRELW